MSIGSDLAGSLRTPAHFCGVYAHKPTLGLAASRGMVPPSEPALPVDLNLAVVGPMARTARDLTLLLDVMAGPDPLTFGLAHRLALPPARHERLRDFRVLVLDEHPLIPTGSAVRAGVHRVAAALVDGGARVRRHSPLLPDLTEAATLYMQLLTSGSVARFPIDSLPQTRADDQSLDAVRLRAMTFSHHDWIEANNRRELHRHGWRQLFAEFDAVVCPITPTPAFPVGEKAEDPLAMYLNDVYTVSANLAGIPAITVPFGRVVATADRPSLPIGVQLVGRAGADRLLLALAARLESVTSMGPRA